MYSTWIGFILICFFIGTTRGEYLKTSEVKDLQINERLITSISWNSPIDWYQIPKIHRNLAGQYLNQDGDNYPALKGLGTTIVVVTCTTAVIFWICHILKSMDTTPFWIMLHFIQLTYLTLMIELYHPLNLIYFLDRLEPWKLDLAWISEFTTIRDKLINDLGFKADRIYFGQIEFDYGSIMVNLAYYWRLIISVLLIHLALKIIWILRNKNNMNNIFFKFIFGAKKEIYETFYTRYLAEVNLFFWIGMIIEFVSTNREWTLQQLSLSFDICLLIFNLVFLYMFIFSFIYKKTKESNREYYMTFFLIKKAIWAIFIVSFAYINRTAQLSILFAIQWASIIFEVVLRPGNWIINTVLSLLSNTVFLVYLGILYFFINSDNFSSTNKGNIAAIFVSVYIIAYGVVVSVYGVFSLLLALFSNHKEVDQNERSFANLENHPRASSQIDEGNHRNTDDNHNKVLINKESQRSDSQDLERIQKFSQEKSDDTSTNKNSKEKFKENQVGSKEYRVSSYVKLRLF